MILVTDRILIIFDLLFPLTDVSMSESGMAPRDIKTKTAGYSPVGIILRDFHLRTIKKNFSWASWLIVSAKESRKRLLQQSCIGSTFWNSFKSLLAKVLLSISIIIAFAGVVFSKAQNILYPVDMYSARLASKPTDAPREEPLSVYMNVPLNHMDDLNHDRYTSSRRAQAFECLY
jgi:hypothetical protein